MPAKSYVDSLHENRRIRLGLSSVFNDQDNEFDNNKIKILDSITVSRNPNLDNELSNENVDDSIGEGTIVSFNQTLQNYLKASVGNDVFNITKYDRIQIPDTTIIKYRNTGDNLLQQRNTKCNDKISNGKKNKTLLNQQKQTAQPSFREKSHYFLSVTFLCILRQVLLIMVKLFLSASNEQIIFILVIYHFIITKFHF